MSDNPQINHGYFNAFYSFQLFNSKDIIDTKKYIRVLEALRDSGILISAETFDKELSFMNSFNELLEDRKKEYRESIKDGALPPLYLRESITKVSDKPKIYIEPTQKGIKYHLESDLIDDLEVSQDFYLHQLEHVYNDEEKYTGIPSKDYKNRFQLLPPLVKDIKGQYFHPGIYLTIYKHGYAILWFCFDLQNYDFNQINYNGWCLPIDQAHFPEFIINNNASFKYKKKA